MFIKKEVKHMEKNKKFQLSLKPLGYCLSLDNDVYASSNHTHLIDGRVFGMSKSVSTGYTRRLIFLELTLEQILELILVSIK